MISVSGLFHDTSALKYACGIAELQNEYWVYLTNEEFYFIMKQDSFIYSFIGKYEI